MGDNIRKLNKIILLALCSFCMTLMTVSFTYAYYYDEDYPEIDSAYWENRTARWDTVGYATKYEVRLYRDGRQVVTKSTSQDSMYLGQYLSNSGDYYFDVRPYNRYTGWGNWMGSDSVYMGGSYYDDSFHNNRYYKDRYCDRQYSSNKYNNDISYAKNQGPTASSTKNPVQNNSNIIMPGSSISNKSNANMFENGGQQSQVINITIYNKQTITVPEPLVLKQQSNGQSSAGRFVESYGIWHYIYDNGAPATNVWVQYKDKWYYIDMNGIMATGLYNINGVTYFLQSDGSMGIGSFVLDGVTHYFDNNGVMIY